MTEKQREELATELPVGEPRDRRPLRRRDAPGVTVSHEGRIFVNFPKWGDDVDATVAELRDGRPVPYPDDAINRTDENDLAGTFVSVQSVVVDPADRLWVLDTGSPMFERTQHGGPKLVCVDLTSERVVQTILRSAGRRPADQLPQRRALRSAPRRRRHGLHHRLLR